MSGSELCSSRCSSTGSLRYPPSVFGARGEHERRHLQEGGAGERILLAAVHGLQRVEEIRNVGVSGEKIEIASNGLFDVILDHGDDQLVLALEIGIERPARKTGRGRNDLDAGAADSLFLKD